MFTFDFSLLYYTFIAAKAPLTGYF